MSRVPPMPSISDAPHAATWLAHAFAQRMVALARRSGLSDEACSRIRHAAYTVSQATSDGHVCVALSDLPGEPGTRDLFPADAPLLSSWRDALLASGICGRPGAGETPSTPLLLDAQDRLYLARYYDYEMRLARSLHALTSPAARDGTLMPADVAVLRQQFGDGVLDTGEPNWQMAAAALALRQRVIILSGGPGTGKTTTVVGLLACLLAREPALRVALAAPTGKAAQRMQEALAAKADGLPVAVRAALPSAALTLHRLLGVAPDSAGMTPRFRHHRDNPLPYDLIVVDEASMIDLSMAAHLIEAVAPQARLILLGDKDQLAAVEAGAVFAELSANPVLSPACRDMLADALGVDARRLQQTAHDGAIEAIGASDAAPLAPLADSVIWLEHNYRFGGHSAIGKLADAIKHGAAADARRCLSTTAVTDDARAGHVTHRESAGRQLSPTHFSELAAGYAGYGNAVASYADDPAPVFEAFSRFRVLCATRSSLRGVDAMNGMLSDAFRLRHAPATAISAADWYAGRPVIVTQNDYALGLFNGDIGIALAATASDPLRVYFPATGGGYREFAPGSLPPHETAFAMTVHKSQGSEFDRVAIVLPERANRVMTRELIYTALTRARTSAALYAPWQVVASAIASPTRRASGLSERLREMQPQGSFDTSN